jgi:hypothetical protein
LILKREINGASFLLVNHAAGGAGAGGSAIGFMAIPIVLSTLM